MKDVVDDWTCPCGHEIDPETKQCIVWTADSWPHFLRHNEARCSCHGYPLHEIERRWGPG